MKKRVAAPLSRGREHAIDSLYDPPLYSVGVLQGQSVDKGYPSYGIRSAPMDYSPDCGMDYLNASRDLSPQYPRIDSALSHNRSFELRDPPGGARYDSTPLVLDRSRSTDSSRYNGSVLLGHESDNRHSDWSTNRNIGPSKNDLNKSNLSYRERWDRSRRTAPQHSDIPPGVPVITPGSYLPQLSYDSNPSVSTELGTHQIIQNRGNDPSPNRSGQWDTPDSVRKGILINPSKSFDANRSTVVNSGHDQSIVAGSCDVMTHDPVTYRAVPHNEQNGSARPVRDGIHNQSGRSIHNTSHVSTQSTEKEASWGVAREDHGTGIQTRLASLAILSLLALVFALLAMQLMFSLIHQTAAPTNTFLSNASYIVTHEVAMAMTCVVIMLDLCCVLVCAMQGLYAAMLCTCHHGNQG